MEEQMKYEKRLVALVDILGFKDYVMDLGRGEDVGEILKLPYDIRRDGSVKDIVESSMVMTSISDSFVFSIRMDDKDAIEKMITHLSVWTEMMLECGLLIRGGNLAGVV